MKTIAIAAILIASFSAHAAPPVAKKMDALHEQFETVRQSADKARLRDLRAQAESLNAQVAAGPADTGCFDASGMLRAMPINIEMQWEAQSQAEAARHLKYWNELNTKYRMYAAQCANSKG